MGGGESCGAQVSTPNGLDVLSRPNPASEARGAAGPCLFSSRGRSAVRRLACDQCICHPCCLKVFALRGIHVMYMHYA